MASQMLEAFFHLSFFFMASPTTPCYLALCERKVFSHDTSPPPKGRAESCRTKLSSGDREFHKLEGTHFWQEKKSSGWLKTPLGSQQHTHRQQLPAEL